MREGQSETAELKIEDNMISVYSFLYTFVLVSTLSSHLVTVAMPATKIDDGVTEQDGIDLLAGDEPMSELAVVPSVYRRSLVLDNNMRDEDENPKIIVVSVSVTV